MFKKQIFLIIRKPQIFSVVPFNGVLYISKGKTSLEKNC